MEHIRYKERYLKPLTSISVKKQCSHVIDVSHWFTTTDERYGAIGEDNIPEPPYYIIGNWKLPKNVAQTRHDASWLLGWIWSIQSTFLTQSIHVWKRHDPKCIDRAALFLSLLLSLQHPTCLFFFSLPSSLCLPPPLPSRSGRGRKPTEKGRYWVEEEYIIYSSDIFNCRHLRPGNHYLYHKQRAPNRYLDQTRRYDHICTRHLSPFASQTAVSFSSC